MSAAYSHGELFAGMSGFGQGFERAGLRTAWRAEIDPGCRALLRRHYPGALLLGDVRSTSGAAVPPVDVLSGGFPCQGLSVAGRSLGLGDQRSSLFFEIPRLVREMREATCGSCPAFVVLENVPGLLSSHGGRDFAMVLGALAQLGPLDICWRVLDSQYFGVAQKRRRVFVVLDFGGERAVQVLFEPKGGARHHTARRKEGEGLAACLSAGSASGSGVNRPGRRREDDVNLIPGRTGSLTSRARRGDGVSAEQIVPVAGGQTARYGKGTDSDATDALLPVAAHSLTASYGKTVDAAGKHGAGPINVVVHSLTAEGHDGSEDGTGRGVPLVPVERPTAFAWQQGDDSKHSATGRGRSWIGRAGDYAAGLSASRHDAVAGSFGVRRLTPTECERLMAVPDGWTALDDQGRSASDSARYRMLGNGVVTTVTEWIGRRIVMALSGHGAGEAGHE